MDFRTNKKPKEKITFSQYLGILCKYWLPFTGRFFPDAKKVGEVVEKVKERIEKKEGVK